MKKEAKELVRKFMKFTAHDFENVGGKNHLKRAKQCALIGVDLVISSGLNLIDYRDYSGDKHSCLNYWQEMKQLIKQLEL